MWLEKKKGGGGKEEKSPDPHGLGMSIHSLKSW